MSQGGRGASRFLGLAARIAVGAVLIVSGASKLHVPKEEFTLVIEAYRLVPESLALGLAAFLPWIELVLGYAVLFGYELRGALVLSGALFAVFDCALISLKIRGIILPSCGCFGSSFHPSPGAMAAADVILIFLALAAFKSPPFLSWSQETGGSRKRGGDGGG